MPWRPRRRVAPTLAVARCRWQPRPGEDHTPTNKGKDAPIDRPGSGGRDRRTAKEFARDLERETEASLRRDPKRWTLRRTNEIPKDRTTEPEAPP
jgi:hypothetical protein